MLMSKFICNGSANYVERKFAEKYQLDVKDASRIINFLKGNGNVLCDDEFVKRIYSSGIPNGCLGLIIPGSDYKYYINVKTATVALAALILDITLTKGAAATLVSLLGMPAAAIVKLDESNGEKCIVKETVLTDGKTGNENVLAKYNGECCNNNYRCKFNNDGKCMCKKTDIVAIYKDLVRKNVFKQHGDFYKYNF